MTFHVYAAFDAEGRPLYVGQTGNLPQRMAAHRSQKIWEHRAAVVFITPAATRREACVLEAERIADLRPQFNFQHNPRHRRLEDVLPDDRPLTVRDRKWLALRQLKAEYAERASA